MVIYWRWEAMAMPDVRERLDRAELMVEHILWALEAGEMDMARKRAERLQRLLREAIIQMASRTEMGTLTSWSPH